MLRQIVIHNTKRRKLLIKEAAMQPPNMKSAAFHAIII